MALKEALSKQIGPISDLRRLSNDGHVTETDMAPAETDETSPSLSQIGYSLPRYNVTPAGKVERECETPTLSSDQQSLGRVLGVNAALPRRLTLPKRSGAHDGPEAVWKLVLAGQKRLLGADHALVKDAKHARLQSRDQQHKCCPLSFLRPLQQSEAIATEKLGMVHPDVAAFGANVTTLRNLICRDNLEPVDDSGVALEVPVSVRVTNVQDEPQPTPSPVEPPSPVSPAPNRSSLPTITTTVYHTGNDPVEQSALLEQEAQNALWNSWRPPHEPKSDAMILAGLVFESLTSVASTSLSWLLRNYGPEPPVASGKVRVRWSCSCGNQLYDDFVERRPGAARELEAYLNRPRAHTPGSPATPSSAGGNHSFGSSIGGPPSTHTTWSSMGSMPRGTPPMQHKPSHLTHTVPTYTPYPALMTEPPWLLTCANEDRFTSKVAHLDMSPLKIKSDKDLALELRAHYSNLNSKWHQKIFKLRQLTTINFVQFEAHQNRFADIRKCPDMPPQPHSAAYDFVPGDLMPPVGPQYLLHLFKHPEDYDGELITYVRVPKRTGRLGLGVGWGVHMVEGFMPERVWMFMNVFFAFVSLIFGIAWACEKNDVQGAFGVAQWISGLALVAGGWAQACLG